MSKLYVNGKFFMELEIKDLNKLLWAVSSSEVVKPWDDDSYCTLHNGRFIPHIRYVEFVKNFNTGDFELFDDSIRIAGNRLEFEYGG